ncbi:MAG: TonB-dependent receptor [Bryobacteraceae bacterium]|nr:TonB-dependent receptor [Bryobacteraceae bacterium]
MRALTATSVLALSAFPALAQLGTATISGTLKDSTGAVLPSAKIVATNAATGFQRTTESNELGDFNLPGLTPGTYDVSVTLQGFKTYQSKGLILQVDQNAALEIQMEVGQVAETVEVTGQTPLLDSQTSSLGAVIDTQKILALPLNGRNFVELALLVPGANSGAPGAGTGGGFSVSGLRSEQNAFQIDGTSNSDGFQNNISVRPSIDALQEFKIQTNNYSAEFGKGAGAQVNVVTKSGTKDVHGTLFYFIRNDAIQARRFFDTNRASFPCDKNDPNVATRAACAPPFNQNQFGFTFGGPVPIRTGGERRTFFFSNYEGFRQVRGAANLNEVATLAQRAGDFSQNLLAGTAGTDALGRTWRRGQIFDPLSSRQVTDSAGRLRWVREAFPGNVIPRSRFDSVSARMVADPEFIPAPTSVGVPAANGDTLDNYPDGRSNRSYYDQGSVRVDHQFSPNDTFYSRLTVNDSRAFNPRSFAGFGTLNDVRNLNGTISYTRVISPTKVNELRLGYLGWFQKNDSERKVDWIGKFGIRGLSHASQDPAIQGSPAISITGMTTLGDDGGLPLIRRNNTYQLIDNFSFNKGRHFMKVGGEVRYVMENVVRAQVTRGEFAFSNAQWTGIDGVGNTGHTFANFLLGLSRQKARRISDFATRLRATEYGGYFQDDFKVSRSLTLNLGVRYMLYLPPHDTRDRISTLISPARCPDFATCGANFPLGNAFIPFWGLAPGTARDFNATALPRSLSPVDKKNFAPRVGFAWQPFGSTTTVIRGGYGMFYDTVPMLLTEDTIENWPFVIEDQQDLGLGQNGLPNSEGFLGFLVERPGLTGPVAPFYPGPNVYSPDFRNAYVQSWNLNIQRTLPGNMIVEIGYVGTKGTRLNRRENTNTAEPLGPKATWGNLTASQIRGPNLGATTLTQYRRLVPYAVQNGVIVPLSNVFETTSTAFSNYHGLQARAERRFSKGLTFISTFTWSKAISDASGFSSGESNGTGNRIQNIFDRRADKGLADQDHRYRFTTAAVYELPFGRGKMFGGGVSKTANLFIGGWALDGILSLQSGYPVTVRRAGDPGSVGTDGALRPDLTCSPNIARGEQTIEKFFKTECYPAPESLVSGDVRYGTAGRSTATGPGLIGLDASLRKITPITEKIGTEFRAEFFNVPNHANWGVPGRDTGSGNFGRITSTADPRILQFALKVIF